MASPVVLSLGSVNADFQVRVEEGEFAGRTVPGRDFRRLSGGKAANVAFLARRLGHPAWLLARVGEDELADQALGPLREAGIDLRHVSAARGHSTAVSMIAVPPDGKKSIVLAANANDAWDETSAADAEAAVGEAPDGSVLAADYEVPAFVVRRAVAAAVARGFPVVLDPSWPARAEREVMARATALTPDAAEGEALAGLPHRAEPAEVARRLAGIGARLVCLKLADGGCLLAEGQRFTLIPPVEVPVVDATGAGDAFAGALAVALLEWQAPRRAACFATAASHLAVTGYGSQPAYPTRDRIEALLPRIEQGVHEFDG